MMLEAAYGSFLDRCRQLLAWNDRCPVWRQCELTFVVRLASVCPSLRHLPQIGLKPIQSLEAEVSEVCKTHGRRFSPFGKY